MWKRIRAFRNGQVGEYHRLSILRRALPQAHRRRRAFVRCCAKEGKLPACDRMIVLSDNAHAGDIIRCCGKEFRLTYEFGSFALE
jgi:hypothetical protein